MIRFELGDQVCICMSESTLSLELNNLPHATLPITQNEYLILSVISCYGSLNVPISQRSIESKIAQKYNIALPENGFKNIIASIRKKFKKLTKHHITSKKSVIENIHRVGYFVPFKSFNNQANGMAQQKRINHDAKDAIKNALSSCLADKRLYLDISIAIVVSSVVFFSVTYYAIDGALKQSYFHKVGDFTDAFNQYSCYSDSAELQSKIDDVELIESIVMVDRFKTRCLITPEAVTPMNKKEMKTWLNNDSYTTQSFDKEDVSLVVRVKSVNLAHNMNNYVSNYFLAGIKVCTNTGTSIDVGETDGRSILTKTTADGYQKSFYPAPLIRNTLFVAALMIVLYRFKRICALLQYFWAIRRFKMKLEPIFDTSSNQNIHYEALSRFQTKNTQRFIETLIANDLLLTHTLLVIRTIFGNSKSLIAPLSINVCPSLLQGKNFSQLYEALSKKDCSYLTVEITENASMYYTEEIYANIDKIKSLGCKISIDDFGTGNNNVELIGKIHPDYLKIDRAFVTGLRQDDKKAETLRQLIAMGKAYHCTIIVEGVETADSAHLLTTLGASIHQGFYYALT
ncbi:EAL domain-containing protein [Vibrio paucivorans]